jgi:tRNA pseudouridine38-40 synthase
MERRPVALRLAYDGSGFRGWQKQPGLPTVQAAVERALAEALGRKVEVHGAARTDSGVHAEGQVCHFVKQAVAPAEVAALALRLAPLLPPGLQLLQAAPAHPSFHARASSDGKRYRYRFTWGPQAAGAEPSFHLGPRAEPRWGLSRTALEGLAGLPALPGLGSPSKDRRPAPPLAAWSLEEREDAPGSPACELRVEGPAFRKHQVRNLAGHLAAVALGLAAPDSLRQLASRGRPWMGATAPPGGLWLVAVRYPAPLDPFLPPPAPGAA